MRYDFEGPIIRSPIEAIKINQASCIEGALIASAIFSFNKKENFLLDLRIDKKNDNDTDHVVTLFKKDGFWGAISKTNHGVLRYREPIYKSVRELTMSYFHEYFTNDGKKNLRSFSKPFNVSKRIKAHWVDSCDDLYEIACELDNSPHIAFLKPTQVRKLRLADKIEIETGKILEWNKNQKYPNM